MDTSDEPTISDTVPHTGPRAHKLAFQGTANRIVRGLLRVPLLCRLVGARLITLEFVGRRSGEHFVVPVAHVRHNGGLLVGTPFAWGRNLRNGEPVGIRLQGRRRIADVTVVTDEAGVVADYAIIARDNHRFAEFNKVGLTESGEPNIVDLHRCWAAGARTFRLTPR